MLYYNLLYTDELDQMGVAEDFKAFRDNYLISRDIISSISLRYRRITKQLNQDFWYSDSETSHSLYVGSYGRDSAAKGISDLDVAFTLPNSIYTTYNNYTNNGQSSLLQAVRKSLQKTYSSTNIGADGQVCVIQFTDGIKFEILPVFINASNSFTHPDSNDGGRWRACNPRVEIDAFLSMNSATNGNLKALARMMRIWKKQHSVSMSGVLIDTLAYNFISTWNNRDKSYLYHDFLVRDFLLYLSQRDTSQQYWSAPGSGARIARKGSFERQAKQSYSDSLRAIDCTTNGQEWSSKTAWQAIFGPTFPR